MTGTVVEDNVLVDVGIPTHGRPRYLVEAVESVLAQTMGRWRLTIAEDGPRTEDVAAALTPYLGDPRVRYQPTGTRLGAAGNMTQLIAGATARYVALLHDDDRWGPEFLATRVAFLEHHPACALALSGGEVIDEDGRTVRRIDVPVAPGAHAPPDFVPLMVRRNVVPTTSVLVRRTAYEAVGARFDARFPHIYDYEMWLRLAARFPVGCIDAHDAYWRRHGAQSSFDGARRGEEQLRFLTHADELVRRELPALVIPERTRRYVRARRMLSAGLDALEHGERARALRYLGRATQTYPPIAANPRVAAALSGVVAGPRARRLVAAARLHARREGLRLPF